LQTIFGIIQPKDGSPFVEYDGRRKTRTAKGRAPFIDTADQRPGCPEVNRQSCAVLNLPAPQVAEWLEPLVVRRILPQFPDAWRTRCQSVAYDFIIHKSAALCNVLRFGFILQ